MILATAETPNGHIYIRANSGEELREKYQQALKLAKEGPKFIGMRDGTRIPIEEYECESCSTIKLPVEDDTELTCPNCHGRNCDMEDVGCWD